MDPRRSAKVLALCGTVALIGWFAVRPAAVDPSVIDHTASATTAFESRVIASLTANTELAGALQANAAVVFRDMPVAAKAEIEIAIAVEPEPAVAAEPETVVAASVATAPEAPKLSLDRAPFDSSPMPVVQAPLLQLASANPSDPLPPDVKEPVGAIHLSDECLVVEGCIDRYLWALYERTPKQDTVKVHERRKVTIKRKGRMVTVTRSFTKLVDQDFAWKDPKAAERVGMPMMDYVIGGMDRSFKIKLFHTLRAAEQAGLSPGITSAFRDDYRQSIATGMKAATDRSYHGGSTRGGYGHGLAADVVSVNGATRAQRWVSTETFWKWIDAHGKEFGIGRPYLGRDPPHVGPIDGKEYAAHQGGMKAHAEMRAKKRTRVAMRDDHATAKTLKKRSPVHAGSAGRTTKHGVVSSRAKMAMADPGRG
jgi:hypothetical protein